MHAHQVYYCVLAVVLVTSTCAAPLQEKQAKEKRNAVAENAPAAVQVADQEAQLENLVEGEKTKGNNVAVHESHVTHYENKDGKESKTEETLEKVTDTDTGKVLAEVKQVTETGSDETGHPQKVTETDIDIPEKGIHKTIIKNDADDTENESEENPESARASFEFSPTEVAKDLLNTFDFDSFYAALKDLVQSSVMTQEEAERYEEQVISEYQRLVAEQNALTQNFINEEPEPYYPIYEETEQKRSNMDPLSGPIADNLYGLDRAYENYLAGDLSFDRQPLMDENVPVDESLSNIIDALLNAWWEKDFEGGNERAMALVSYLYDVVSRDQNPNDILQIRNILADMLANALLDDVQDTEYKMEQAAAEESADNMEKAPEVAEEESKEKKESQAGPEEELKEAAEVAKATEEVEAPSEPDATIAKEPEKKGDKAKEKKEEEEKH